MNPVLIIVGLAFFAFLARLKRDWGLYLIILLLPTYQIRFQVVGIPMTFLEGMILILAVIVIANEVKQSHSLKRLLRHFVPRNDIAIFILLLLLAATISIFVSPVPVKAAGIWKAFFVEPVIFYFLVLRIVDSQEKLKKLFLIITGLVLYVSVFGIYQFLTLYHLPFSWWAVDIEGRRIISFLNHPNALALLLGPLLGILIFLPEKTKFLRAGIILGLAALFLSFSRAGWLALFGAVVVFGLIKIYNSPLSADEAGSPPLRLRGGWGALLIILIAVLTVLVIPFSREKLISLARGQDPAQQNRIVLWSAALDLIKKHPLTGVGLMGFHETYKNYPLGPDRVVQNYPHNFFLNFWLETGLLGLTSIIALLVIFYQKKPPLPLAAGMTVILLHGLVDVPYFKNDLSVLFWLVYSLGFIKILRSGSSPVLSVVTSKKRETSA